VATKKPDASKTTAQKKPAAKKTTAKSTTASKPKAAAKKPAAKKPAAKKAPAKTAAASTTASKPNAAANKPAAKKPAAKKAAKKPGTKKKPAAKKKAAEKPTKYAFEVGDKVVYPHHGAATIIKKERIDFAGERRDYFVLEVATDQLTVRVPAESALERGVRPVISKNKAKQVFATFKEEPQEAGSNWSRWYKLLTEKINSGDIFQVAEVIRDLTYAQQIKGISPALKRMLAKARLIIVSELQFTLDLDEEEAIKKLDRALPKVDAPDED
jgi:CarD family transcriptional regulator, regulator of rRNA transcription